MKIFNYKKSAKNSQYSTAFLFSILFHFCSILFLTYKTIPNAITLTETTNKPHHFDLTKVKFISANELQQIKKEYKNRQIVANETNGINKAPSDSRFAGEKDQSFDRQTMARINGSFKEAGLGSTEKVVKKERKTSVSKKINFTDLGTIAINSSPDLKEEVREQKLIAGSERGKAGVVGPAANNDFVEEVALGDMTNLNTTEFKYYGFYHRIRQKLEQHWGNTIQEKAKKLYKGGRRLPASENMITAISVTLDNHGSIIDIKVDGTSGVRELDQAAIESFNKAGPFPNPPTGLLVDGKAIIQWGFVVKG